MTITITDSSDTSKFEKLLKFLYRERIPFSFDPNSPLSSEELAIQERLQAKYGLNGQWADMSDDAKQDAALLEKILYLEETGQAEPLNYEENNAFKDEIKTWL